MTKLPIATLATALLLASLPAGAQQPVAPTPLVTPSGTILSVAAEGRVERAPDIADLSAGVVTSAPTASQAMRDNATRMTTVIAALRKEGVPERDIQTTGLSLQPQYHYRENQPPQLTGYQAVNNVSVQLRKLGDIGRIIDVLVAQGANQVNGPNFRLDQPDVALDEARTQAVQKARQRADLYARSLGMQVRRIVQVNEGGYAPPPVPMMVPQMARDVAEKSVTTPIAPGQVQLTIPVNVVFELQ